MLDDEDSTENYGIRPHDPLTTIPTMAWSQEEITKFEDIVTRLAAESHMAQPGKDDGLIPIYSLVNDIADSLPEDNALNEAVEAIQDMLQPKLDTAEPFDEATIEAMKTFANWCADSLYRIRDGKEMESYVAEGESEQQNGESELADIEIPADPEPSEDEPIGFQEAKEEIQGGKIDWTEIEIQDFGQLGSTLSSELVLAEPGSDEGMLPIYSLLQDFQSSFEARQVVLTAVEPVFQKIDALVDAAKPMDSQGIKILTEFNIWLESSLNELKSGVEPMPFKPSIEYVETAQTEEVVNDQEDGGLAAEFAEFDVVMDLNMEENKELLEEFHTEAVDHLGQIETAVLELEQDVGNRDAINSMFRSFHTIKGVAGFLNLIPVNRLAHEVESLMDLVRNDELNVFTGVIDLVLESKDTISRLIEQISDALADGTLPSEIIPVSHLMVKARWAMKGPEEYANLTGEPAGAAETNLPAGESPGSQEEVGSSEEDLAAMDQALAELKPEEPKKAEPAPVAAQAPAQNTVKRKATESASIRVNTWKLDNLMDMVGELVIVQSQLHECSKDEAHDNSVFQRNMSQLTRITKELQHTSMALRMIPIKPTFQKMGRIVRDLAAKSGKKVRFEVSGEDTELDRNVVEEIGDPLVHMIRNALDHGLEPPEDREAVGKSDTGYVALKAYHQGSSIVIELSDDGRGIDAEKVLQKAIKNGVVREDENLSREEIFKLIFAPGFSTAEQITDISGRGVGMDVVKKNIEKLRGKVEIESELGKGSVFRILLPLTMAIVDGLVVKVGDDRFILPTTSVKVALRPDEQTLAKIQGNEEILNIRGKIIPLFRLHDHFQIPKAITDPRDATVVVVETTGKPCGLLVDDMVSKQEVVIKSLGSMMQGIPGVSGGAILGDGTIALILDPATLISVA